jgi:hypothetical protein
MKGGGNIRHFIVYAVRNCPRVFLPICLLTGITRRAGGYLSDWVRETR